MYFIPFLFRLILSIRLTQTSILTMVLNSKSTLQSELQFEDDGIFTIGIRELLFLGTILVIGFCGFTVCVDKIYSVADHHQDLESITVHSKDLSLATQPASTNPYSSYSLSIEN